MSDVRIMRNQIDRKVETSLCLDGLQVRKTAMVLRALNHKLRQRILQLLAENGGLTVSEIYGILHLEQSIASQHLSILRRAGFVRTSRDGKFIRYEVDTERLDIVSREVEIMLGIQSQY